MKAKKIFEEIRNSKVFYSLIGLIILVIFSAIAAPNFRTVDNIITVFRQASVLLVLSAGLTAVLLTGGMDLSVGATAGFIGCICAQCIKNGVPIPAAFILGILIGLVVGVINGLLAGILPSFIATYGTNWVMSGLAVLVMQGAVIYDLPKGFTQIGVGYTGPVPNLIIIAAVVVILIYVLLQKTTYGRQVYAYGSNPVAAKYAAVPVKKVMLSAFMMCSMCAGLAGMQTVAAVVVGGTSMLGGEGGVLGTVVGALILTIIVNVMNLKGISSYAQGLVIGIVIIAMVLFDTYSKRRQESKAA